MIKSAAEKVIRNQSVFRFASLKQKLYDALYINDPSTPASKILNSSLLTGVEGLKQTEVQSTEPRYTTSTLPNGVRVITENTGVPSNVQLGILLDIGTRDETVESSGALLSIKNTYFKTVLNTNETINYGIHQMSGGHYEMDYDREFTYFHASCLAHDVVDVFSMMTDCALEPRSVVAANVAIHKNSYSHKLDSQLGGNNEFNDNLYRIAYGGYRGLGMPLNGIKGNVSNLTAYVLQKFQLQNISPDRIVIAGGNVDNHQEFADLVNEKFSTLLLSSKPRTRETSVYTGGEVRNLTESNLIHAALVFEGASASNSAALHLAKHILDCSCRTSSRIKDNVLAKSVFIDSANSYGASYSDSGLFGIKLAGSAAHARDIVDIAVRELRGLTNITHDELNTVKTSLKAKLGRSRQCDTSRLGWAARRFYTNGTAQDSLLQQIDQVTTTEVEEAVKKALKSHPTLLVQGGEVNTVGSYDSIANSFR